MSYNLITILGPTATGKTKLAAMLSSIHNGEIISADSRQVYIGMDIGTGKDYKDYITPSGTIPYHLIDIINPSEEYNLYLFKKDFIKIFYEITSRKKTPFLTGGTGLYLSAILQNYKLFNAFSNDQYISELASYSNEELKEILIDLKPDQHNDTDLINKERLIQAILVARSEREQFPDTSFINSFVIGINPGRDEIKKRITHRLKERLNTGMIEEVKSLMEQGVSKERMLLFGLEYKFISLYITGELTYNDMFQKLNSSIHSFAKRQMTWYRKMEKEGVSIHWIDSADVDKASSLIKEFYDEYSS